MEEENRKIKIHSVKYNFAMNIILKISQYIFPLITLPYITRTLGTIGNGKVAFASSVITYFSMFAQLGIPSYGVRECARCRDDKEKLTRTVHELLVINGFSVIVSYAVLFISMAFLDKFQEEPVLLLVNSAVIVLNMLGMEWLYQAVEQYQYITIRNISFKLLSVVLMFALVHNPEDYIIYGCLTVLSSCGSYILNVINSRKLLSHKKYSGSYSFRKHLRPIFVFFGLSVAVSVYTSMDTVMLGFISGDEQVAFYSLSTKIKLILASSISALGPVLLPRITYCLSNGWYDKFENYIRKSMHFVILASVPVTIYFIVMAPQVIDILGGDEYEPAILCMRIITMAVIPLGIGNVACSQILTPLGKEKLTMYSTIYGAIINFFANLVLIHYMGAAGAAFATVLAEGIIACIQIHYVWNEVADILNTLPYIKMALSNCIATVVLLAYLKWISFSYSLLDLVISCILFFGIYVFSLIILKDDLISQYISYVVRKIVVKKKRN